MKQLRLAGTLSALVLAACGGNVESPTASGAPGSGAPAGGARPDDKPNAQADASVAVANVVCSGDGVVHMSGDIVDVAVDATDIWALEADGAGAWRVEKAPKCGGAPVLVGAPAVPHTPNFAPTPLRLGIVGERALVLAWDGRSHDVVEVSKVENGSVTALTTTLYGPSDPPLALAIAGERGFWGLRGDLHAVSLAGGDSEIATGLASDQNPGARVEDIVVAGDFAYGIGAGKVFRYDLRSQSIYRTSVLLMSDSRRFVRASAGSVYVIGTEIWKLPADLSESHPLVLGGSGGAPQDVALHARYLFVARVAEHGSFVQQVTLDGSKQRTIPALTGDHLAVDDAALFVGRGREIQRIAVQDF